MKRSFYKSLKPYMELSKIRLSAMNAFMPVAGYYSCAATFNPAVAAALLGGNLAMAMTSQILGQRIEVKQDALMKRTSNRPLVTREISTEHADYFMVGCWATSNLILASTVPISSVIASNMIIPCYLGYLYAKRKTDNCLLIGSVAGSLSLLVGGLAAGGFAVLNTKLTIDILFMFFWQMPHFLNILANNQSDYKNAGFKMPEGADRLTNMYFLYTGCLIATLSLLEEKDVFHRVVKAVLVGICLLNAYLFSQKMKRKPHRFHKFDPRSLCYLTLVLYYFVYNFEMNEKRNEKIKE
jgi:heme O synthase-like polyprenyltransferase